jgi:hypothetical protein
MRGLESALLLIQIVAPIEGPGLGLRDARRLRAGGYDRGIAAWPRVGGVVSHGRESLLKIESVGPVWGACVFPTSVRRATMFGILAQVDMTRGWLPGWTPAE